MSGLLRFFAGALCGFLVLLLGGFSPVAAVETSAPSAVRFLERVKSFYGRDIVHVLKQADEQISDEVSEQNLQWIYQALEYHYYLENKDRMRTLADQMEKIAAALGRPSFVRMAAVYRTYCLALDGKYDAAIKQLESQLEEALRQNDNLTAITIYDALAALVPFQGEYYVALQYADQASRRLSKAPYQNRLRLHLYYTLTYIYTELDDLDKAFEFANLSLDIIENSGLYTDLTAIVYNVGVALQSQKNHQMSNRYLTELISFYQDSGQEELSFYPLYGLALNHYRQEQPAETMVYVEKALKYVHVSEDFAASLYQLGAIQAARLGRVDQARDYYTRAHLFFDKYPEYKDSRWNNMNLRVDAEIANAEGRYEEAFKMFNQFHIKDREEAEKSFSSDVLKLRAGLEATMRIEKAEQKLLLEKNDLHLQRMTYLIMAFLIVLVVIMIAFVVQRRTVIALDQIRRDAEIANRTKTEFLANISHELRTPLNAIIGFSDMMTAKIYGPLGNRYYEQYADMINKSGQHLLNIINEILDMSKIESGKFELHEQECDLIEIAHAAVKLMNGKQNGKNVVIDFAPPETLPDLYADQQIVNQIFFNALSNAVKFNKPDGRVEVSLHHLPENGAIQIKISDTGIGMSEQELAQVMKPFAQVQNSMTRAHEGTGLGLPLMAAFMKLHGGSVDIESEKGVGTTLILTFPPKRTMNPAA